MNKRRLEVMVGSHGGLNRLKQWPKPLKEHLEGGEPSAVICGERESREAGAGKWGWTSQVPACTFSPLRCSFLGQPSAATRPRSLRRNCQIKMNHLAHNGRGAYRGRAGPRRRLISAAHTAGANEAAGGSGIRARGWARAGAAQHGHARTPGRKNRSIPSFFPGAGDGRLARPSVLTLLSRAHRSLGSLSLGSSRRGGHFPRRPSAAPPAGETLFLPSPFPFAQ